jgi:hypothetical protein
MTSMQCSQSQPTVAFFFRVQSWTGFFLLSKQFIHNNNSLVVHFPMVILRPLWTQIRRSTLSRRKDPLFERWKTTGLNCDLQTNWYFCSTYSVSMETMDRGCPVFFILRTTATISSGTTIRVIQIKVENHPSKKNKKQTTCKSTPSKGKKSTYGLNSPLLGL